MIPALEKAKEKMSGLVEQHKLRDDSVRVTVGALSPEQAIGNPARPDFVLRGGKEVMIQAQFKGHFGQAFTNRPRDFSGRLDDVLNLNLDTANNRAIFIATLNAVCSCLGLAGKTRHCRNEELEECGSRIAGEIISRFGKIRIGMVGYQPAILENLVKAFGAANIRCSDLDAKNIGANKFGVIISDGHTENRGLILWCDLVLATSSANVNNTLDDIYGEALAHNKDFIMFGVSGAGLAALSGIERICPCGHD